VTGSELIEASRGTAEGDLGPDVGVEQEASLSAHIHSRTPLGTGVSRPCTNYPAAPDNDSPRGIESPSGRTQSSVTRTVTRSRHRIANFEHEAGDRAPGCWNRLTARVGILPPKPLRAQFRRSGAPCVQSGPPYWATRASQRDPRRLLTEAPTDRATPRRGVLDLPVDASLEGEMAPRASFG
jgi:hypothetical protein